MTCPAKRMASARYFSWPKHGAFVPTVSDKRCGQASVPVRQFEHADLFLHHGQADSFVLLFRHFDETCAFLVQIEAVSRVSPAPASLHIPPVPRAFMQL